MIILHENVGSHVPELSVHALRLIIKLGEFLGRSRYATSNAKPAHFPERRYIILRETGLTPQQWEQAVLELQQTEILDIEQGRGAMPVDTYYFMRPNIPARYREVNFRKPKRIK